VTGLALGIDGWTRPYWILLLPLVAWALLHALRSPPASIPWPGMAQALRAGARSRDPLRGLALALRGAALLALAGVMAGPVGVHRLPPEPGFGLDLVLAVDASGSMRSLDAEVDGHWRSRLDLAREVVGRFAEQRAAEGDRVGLVVFGESVFTACPLTSDGALLAAALGRVRPGMAGEATALGDALVLGVRRALGSRSAGSGPAGRVVVLLTDGRSNAGAVSVESATGLAAGEGIRVHAVAIGSDAEEVAIAAPEGAPGRGLRFERHDVDRASLRRVADATGGRFFEARRSSDLAPVYAAIDELERTPRARPPRVARTDRPEPLLALAGLFVLAEIAASRVLWRALP
jgi:Ca-activated chloride channel family protein